MNSNLFDNIISVIILLFGTRGYYQGFIKKTTRIISFSITLYIVKKTLFFFQEKFSLLFIGGKITLLVTLFITTYYFIKHLISLILSILKDSLGDRILGFCIGISESFLLITIIIWLGDYFQIPIKHRMTENQVIIQWIRKMLEIIYGSAIMHFQNILSVIIA